MQIKGKQIANSSVKQNNLNVTTDSIISVSAVTNAEYINNEAVNKVEQITYSTLNIGMVAKIATVGVLACDTHVIEFPISNTMVRINNVYVTVGENADCYFSPDGGTTKRIGGNALKGDFLYWNSTRFNLDATDEIDFVYITASDVVELASGTTVELDPYYPALNVKYTGNSGTMMTVIIDGVSFTVGNVAGSFVWDIGGANEHTFTTVGEAWLQTVNTVDYTIWYDGIGSILYSIKRGKFIIDITQEVYVLGVNNSVYYMMKDSNQNIIVNGNFTSIYEQNNNGIIKLNQDARINSSMDFGTGFNSGSSVYKILKDSNNKYVVGGSFTSYKGLSHNRIIRLNQDGSLDSTFNTGSGFGGAVRSIIQDSNGKYIIGGEFTIYKGLTQNRIIRLNQDGSLDSTFDVGTAFNNHIYSIIQDTNGKYVIGGYFTTYKGLTQNRIIRLNQDGSLDSTFVVGTGFDNIIYSIIQDSNGKYLIGGFFATYKGLSQIKLARLNQDGSLDSTFIVGTGFDAVIYTMIQDSNGKYVIGGAFTTYKGLSQNRICRLEQDGTLDTSLVIGTGFNAIIYTIIQNSDGKYVMGGVFNSYKGLSQNYIAMLEQNGTLDIDFINGGGFNNHVYSIIQEITNEYMIGGTYTAYSNLMENRFIKIKTNNYLDLTFDINDGFNGFVFASINDSNNKYVVGGDYTTYNLLSQNRLVRLNQNGSIDTSFNIGTGFNLSINTLIEDSNNKYVMGGAFTTYNALTQNNMARLNQNGSLDSTFDIGTGFNGTIRTILYDSNNKYVVGGLFTTYKGLTQNRIARLNQDGSLDSTFDIGTGFNGTIYSIKQDSNGKYLIGGDFTTYKGLTQNRICRLNQDGTLDSTFVIGTGFGVSFVYNIIEDSNNKYVIIGNFTTYKGIGQPRICRLEQNGTLDTSFVVGGGFNNTAYSIVQDSNGKYVIGGIFTGYQTYTISYYLMLNQDGTIYLPPKI